MISGHSLTVGSSFNVKSGWFNCAPIALNCAANIFNCADPHPQVWWEGNAPIAIFDAKPPGINCASIALNCADTIFNCTSPHLEIQGGGFRSSVPPLRILGWKWSRSIGFQLCLIVQQSFWSYSSSFWDLGLFFQYIRLGSMTEVRLPSPLLFSPFRILVSKQS